MGALDNATAICEADDVCRADARSLLELMKAREEAYALLSSLFFEPPSSELAAAIVSIDRRGASLDGAERGEAVSDEAVEEIEADMARLLYNMSQDPVSPYESVYLSPEHLLMQEQRDSVVEEYRLMGFEMREGINLPEDHVAVELEHMSSLARKAAERIEEGDTSGASSYLAAQKRFLSAHLVRWIAPFCNDLSSRARTTFYESLGHLTCQFVDDDMELLIELGKTKECAKDVGQSFDSVE